MSNQDKWFFGFITLWIVLCAGKPDLLDAISTRVAGTGNQEEIDKLKTSLVEHKVRENFYVKALYSNNLIDEKDYYKALSKSIE